MTACPYRREHEYDAEGLCANCYQARPAPPPVPAEVEITAPMPTILDPAMLTTPFWPWGGGTTP